MINHTMVLTINGTRRSEKAGPSARELLDDKIYDGFAHASAMKTLFSLIDKAKKD